MRQNWYFPPNCGGEETGLNDSGIETFRSSGDLAREVVQNSIDACIPGSNSPVCVKFELLNVPKDEIPGAKRLCTVIERCIEYLRDQCETEQQRAHAGEGILRHALELLRGSSIPVLAIHDSGTTGLRGDDTRAGSAWHRLVRAQGTPRRHGAQGGTFGIGQRAPFAFSALRTVLYSTRSDEGDRFVGKSILSSFRDNGTTHRNVGHYGALQGENGGAFGLTGMEIPQRFRRSEKGTTVYVLGYESTGWRFEIASSIMENFFAAVEHARVEVELIGDGRVDMINRTTIDARIDALIEEAPGQVASRRDLQELGESLRNVRWYLRALRSPHGGAPIRTTLKHLGEVQLHLALDPSAPEKTMYMRRPRIAVYDRTRRLGAGYAAVFLCDDDEGNGKLAGLEDPTHKKWERDRNDGAKILQEMTRWVNQQITELVQGAASNKESAPDLGQYLPADEKKADVPDRGVVRKTREHQEQESAREQKKPEKEERQTARKRRDAPPPVTAIEVDEPDEGDRDDEGIGDAREMDVDLDGLGIRGAGQDEQGGHGSDPGASGANGGGSPGGGGGGAGERTPIGAGPGQGAPGGDGDKASRGRGGVASDRHLRPDQITFRSYFDPVIRAMRMILRASRSGRIDPILVALGEDGSAYAPSIERVTLAADESVLSFVPTKLGKTDAITVKGVTLLKGKPTELIVFLRGGTRATLGVEGVNAA